MNDAVMGAIDLFGAESTQSIINWAGADQERASSRSVLSATSAFMRFCSDIHLTGTVSVQPTRVPMLRPHSACSKHS